MEQFSLDTWLQDKSHKVVTRSGVEAEIIHDKYPLVAIINGVAYNFDNDGKFQSNRAKHPYDLFFADEGEELTEFEKRFIELIRLWRSGNTNPEENLTQSQFDAKELLDLARKEILKDLPKWKDVSGKNGAGTKDYKIVGYYLVKGNHAIYLENLEKLPKEE